MNRTKVDGYPGIFVQEIKRIDQKGFERMYYSCFKRRMPDGTSKLIWAKCGRQSPPDAMTPAKASLMRAEWIRGKMTPQEQRKAAEAKKALKRWTLNDLAEDYFSKRPEGKSKQTDQGRYALHLREVFGSKRPEEIHQFSFDKFRHQLEKSKSPQTVAHCVNLLKWIVGHGTRKKLCKPLDLNTRLKHFDNRTTEDLTTEQLKALLKAIGQSDHPQAGNFMRLALLSGLRRGEMLKLKWSHINFSDHEILLVDPKGGKDQRVPMSEATETLLKSIERTSPYVFPGKGGGQRDESPKAIKTIALEAGLPNNFRPLHGLRHFYARSLVNAGVSIYEIQRLLTHKNPLMTARYAELRNETLRKASNVAGDLLADTLKEIEKDKKSEDTEAGTNRRRA